MKRLRNLLRLLPVGLLGAGAAVLVSCGSSGKGLIPVSYAGPLQEDFQAVLTAAQQGNGSCAETDAKIAKAEADLQGLPASVDAGLRGRLAEGVVDLGARARQLCGQPSGQTTTTGTTTSARAPKTTTPPSTTPTSTPTTAEPPETTPTTGTSTAPTNTGPSEQGGSAAPGVGNGEGQAGEGESGNGGNGGAGAGQSEGGAGAGPTGGAGAPGGGGQ
jgi:hypothetical protein